MARKKQEKFMGKNRRSFLERVRDNPEANDAKPQWAVGSREDFQFRVSDEERETHTVVWASPKKVIGKIDPTQAISLQPGGKGQITHKFGGRIKEAKRFWKEGGIIDPPSIDFKQSETRDVVTFLDGRHRVVAAHQLGEDFVPFLVPNEKAKDFASAFGGIIGDTPTVDRPVKNAGKLGALRAAAELTEVDEILLDALIRNHALLLTESEAGTIAIVEERLSELEDTLRTRAVALTEKGFGDTRRVKRFNEVAGTLKAIRKRGLESAGRDIEAGMVQAARSSAQGAAGVMRQASPEIEILVGFNRLSADQVRAATQGDFLGFRLNKWINAREITGGLSMQRELRASFLAGDSIDETVRNMAAVVGKVTKADRRELRTIARTTINGAANEAVKDLYQRNSDVLKGMRWIATLDSRICEECMALDGRVMSIKNPARVPPAHEQCRCFLAPVVKGFPSSKIPTASEWINRQPASIQDKVLGVGGGRLLRDPDSQITASDFLRPRGGRRTLAELNRLSRRRKGEKAA